MSLSPRAPPHSFLPSRRERGWFFLREVRRETRLSSPDQTSFVDCDCWYRLYSCPKGFAIKDVSKPTLDKIVARLKVEPGWKPTIEGHIDSTAQHGL